MLVSHLPRALGQLITPGAGGQHLVNFIGSLRVLDLFQVRSGQSDWAWTLSTNQGVGINRSRLRL